MSKCDGKLTMWHRYNSVHSKLLSTNHTETLWTPIKECHVKRIKMLVCLFCETFAPGTQLYLVYIHERRVETSKARHFACRKTLVHSSIARTASAQGRILQLSWSDAISSSTTRCGQALSMGYAHLIKIKLVGSSWETHVLLLVKVDFSTFLINMTSWWPVFKYWLRKVLVKTTICAFTS